MVFKVLFVNPLCSFFTLWMPYVGLFVLNTFAGSWQVCLQETKYNIYSMLRIKMEASAKNALQKYSQPFLIFQNIVTWLNW